jgi:hypothetical protein
VLPVHVQHTHRWRGLSSLLLYIRIYQRIAQSLMHQRVRADPIVPYPSSPTDSQLAAGSQSLPVVLQASAHSFPPYHWSMQVGVAVEPGGMSGHRLVTEHLGERQEPFTATQEDPLGKRPARPLIWISPASHEPEKRGSSYCERATRGPAHHDDMASLVQLTTLSADWYEPAHEAHAKGSPRSLPQRCRSAVAHSRCESGVCKE